MSVTDGGKPGDRPLHPDLEAFFTHLAKERDVSPNTLRAYRKDLAAFATFLTIQLGETFTWDQVDRLVLRGFLGYLTRAGLSKRSTARSLSAVRTLFKFLHREDVIETNPARAVSRTRSTSPPASSRTRSTIPSS